MSEEDTIGRYDFELPPELIAQYPAERRDESRLLVVHRKSGSIAHHAFADLPDLLDSGDLLVRNNTRVVPARLFGVRTQTGGKWEGLFLRQEPDLRWRIIGQTRGRLEAGESITLKSRASEELELVLEERTENGEWLCRPKSSLETLTLLTQFGSMPLPPYVRREANAVDFDRYQTTYAKTPGAVAAPTAGLHFTAEIITRCEQRGIHAADVTLHVGMGTFRPVSVDRLADHHMHSEWCELPATTVDEIRATRQSKRRIVAVGTTSVRTLESVASRGELRPFTGETNLFIRPPYEFRCVDALITNFHLPKSTLLVLVCTFAGRELMLRAYDEAIRERYRFFSYGDAMLIV